MSETVDELRGALQSAPEITDRALLAAYEASLAVASEINVESLLQRIVDLARGLVDARYAALGVINIDGRIESFFTSGLSPEERAAIGPVPVGLGLLGALARSREPILVPVIQDDPRSAGFPPHHPPMRTMLGVPILLWERNVGNLYLCDRSDGRPFDVQDQTVVQVLAGHAAAAIDRATLYRQLEQSRRGAEEQRDQLRSILDNLPSAVIIQSSIDLQIELANNAAVSMMLGDVRPAGTLPVYGRDFAFLQKDGAELPFDRQPGIRALRGEVIRNQQLIIRQGDGQASPVLVQAGPLRDSSGGISRAVVVIQDVTKLREAEQLKDDFISLVSHELRTPITAVYGGAHLLLNQGDTLSEETCRDLLNDIMVESERLNQMLANLLGLTSVKAGRMEPSTEPVLLEPLSRKVAADINKRSDRHQLTVDISPYIPPVEADPNHLEQVLRNLFENAVKYSPDGGTIQTSATTDGQMVRINITDPGVGIAPEHVGSLFERFRRPGAPATIRGMGLGLYLSRHMVEAQGGTISATSAGPGKGATFSITLPIATGWEP
jgi:signal transduction histidine kinase